MKLDDVPADLLDLAWDAWVGSSPDDELGAIRAALAAVLPAHERQAVEAERAAIIRGIKHYFAPIDDSLFEDVEVLCGRIERGEYGARRSAQ